MKPIALLLCLALAACSSTPAVVVPTVSTAGVERETRRAVRANDETGAQLERARIALERARKLLARKGGK